MCAARTAVSCRRDGTAISKTHLPDRGTITAPGGGTSCGPAWKADELSAAWRSRFPPTELMLAGREAVIDRPMRPRQSDNQEAIITTRYCFCMPAPSGLQQKFRNTLVRLQLLGERLCRLSFLTLMASMMGLLYTALWLLIAYGVVIMIFRHAFGIELPNPFELLPTEWRQKLPYVLPEVK